MRSRPRPGRAFGGACSRSAFPATLRGRATASDPDGARPWGGLEDMDALLALAGSIDVLFLGLGADIAIPPRALIATLEDAGVMTEPMSTPSAARSYNVTLSEGRRVACALIPL